MSMSHCRVQPQPEHRTASRRLSARWIEYKVPQCWCKMAPVVCVLCRVSLATAVLLMHNTAYWHRWSFKCLILCTAWVPLTGDSGPAFLISLGSRFVLCSTVQHCWLASFGETTWCWLEYKLSGSKANKSSSSFRFFFHWKGDHFYGGPESSTHCDRKETHANRWNAGKFKEASSSILQHIR